MGIWKREEPEQEPVLPVAPEDLEKGREPVDAIPVERGASSNPEFSPYDNWPRIHNAGPLESRKVNDDGRGRNHDKWRRSIRGRH